MNFPNLQCPFAVALKIHGLLDRGLTYVIIGYRPMKQYVTKAPFDKNIVLYINSLPNGCHVTSVEYPTDMRQNITFYCILRDNNLVLKKSKLKYSKYIFI